MSGPRAGVISLISEIKTLEHGEGTASLRATQQVIS